MSDDYDVGYGKPPRQHRFKPGNAAAKGRRRKKPKAVEADNPLSIPEILDRALRTKRKIKRGEQVLDMEVADILVERLVQTMTSGSARDLQYVINLIERFSPGALASSPKPLEVIYHHAEGSKVALPPADLWKEPKS
ncbi:DUF5681 domain-containing protein [Novosphingobium sp. Gsoil 351]|uniref:DUF5681 domain-containing protein n=1 Tax=Novosphingobium sp. Gsoil 351 TaxID=2675225 RepID=UPI0012B49C22|nr:DUF5681 domain-containing protein [Novosphingobium sp. Gsoil 351]QGN55011.1 hypothetical protein GKE62_11040 [Novosphingobium sp. Gsoil 351]